MISADLVAFLPELGTLHRRKLAALRCHRTQLGANNPLAWIDEAQARQWLGTEYFRRARIAGRDESPLEQLGEPVPSP